MVMGHKPLYIEWGTPKGLDFDAGRGLREPGLAVPAHMGCYVRAQTVHRRSQCCVWCSDLL